MEFFEIKSTSEIAAGYAMNIRGTCIRSDGTNNVTNGRKTTVTPQTRLGKFIKSLF